MNDQPIDNPPVTNEPGNDLPVLQQPASVAPPTAMPAQPSATSLPAPDFDGHVPAGQTMPLASTLVPAPDNADDGDLIEKEWVEKAKQIVEHTAEDPFIQQQELSKMRADYMKKRYNKDLGVA